MKCTRAEIGKKWRPDLANSQNNPLSMEFVVLRVGNFKKNIKWNFLTLTYLSACSRCFQQAMQQNGQIHPYLRLELEPDVGHVHGVAVRSPKIVRESKGTHTSY